MNDLVKIEKVQIGQETVSSVNARELHEKLQVGRDFSTWIKGRLSELNFVEGIDYTRMAESSLPETGERINTGFQKVDYIISLDMAKHLAMLERNEIGRQVRRELIREHTKMMQSLALIEFKGEIDGLVFSKNGRPITTSTAIAKVFRKEHFHVLRDIDDEIEKLKEIHPDFDGSNEINPNLDGLEIITILNDFVVSEYMDSNNRTYRQYELGEMATMQIALKYSSEIRAKFIVAFKKMRESLAKIVQSKLLEDILPMDNTVKQYVYIIKNPLNETIKIGVAKDVKRRLEQLRTGAGVELELLYTSMLCSNAFNVEKDTHEKFAQFRTFGEWFKVNPQDVIDYLESKTYVIRDI